MANRETKLKLFFRAQILSLLKYDSAVVIYFSIDLWSWDDVEEKWALSKTEIFASKYNNRVSE